MHTFLEISKNENNVQALNTHYIKNYYKAIQTKTKYVSWGKSPCLRDRLAFPTRDCDTVYAASYITTLPIVPTIRNAAWLDGLSTSFENNLHSAAERSKSEFIPKNQVLMKSDVTMNALVRDSRVPGTNIITVDIVIVGCSVVSFPKREIRNAHTHVRLARQGRVKDLEAKGGLKTTFLSRGTLQPLWI